MNRFFSKDLKVESSELLLAGGEAHHLKNVLRLKPGDQVELFNGKGLLATGRIDAIGKSATKIIIQGKPKINTDSESPVKITLLQGLLKGSRNEEIIKDSTVLNAANIRLFRSEYTAIKPNKNGAKEGLIKWQRVSIEAAKQCGRRVLPEIEGPLNLEEALKLSGETFKIALFESEEEEGLKQYLKNHKEGQDVAVLIGPEGGLSGSDLETIRAAGFHTVRMGPLRLRSEAAARTVLSIIGYALGGLGNA